MEQAMGMIQARRRVLVVDDELINREILGEIVGGEYEVLYAENGRQALGTLRRNRDTLSLVLLDLSMPEMDGLTVLETMREDPALAAIPVIVLTGDTTAELQSLRIGAADFLTKPYIPEVIRARVSRVIELTEGRALLRAAEKDELTGLYTRSFFFEYAQQFERYHPDWEMDAVAVNIDRFHLVNEVYGRDFGDRVLRLLANCLRDFLSTTDGIACHCEADSFFLYCVHQEDYSAMLDTLYEGISGISRTVRLHLRTGVCENVGGKLDVARCFDRAKSACDMLRGDYTRSVLVYDNALHSRELFAGQLINDVAGAIERGELTVCYQPQFDITGETPALSSAEALVRWEHPVYGEIGPGDFIPLFEKNGLIQLVDHYVWREAARQIRAWQDAYGLTVPIAVNVSRTELYDPSLVETLLGIVDEFGISTADLVLEIAEPVYAEEDGQLIGAVGALRISGFRVEMDNFGSGSSSLLALFSFPVDSLKLDMRFLRELEGDERSRRLIELIMEVAASLPAVVVAEGVETAEQCALLKDAGCGVAQGYYFAASRTAAEFEEYLAALC